MIHLKHRAPLAALLLALLMTTSACGRQTQAGDLPLHQIELPPGFAISVYAGVEKARQMALGDNGTVFVGARGTDRVVAVRDQDRDGTAEQVWEIASGLNNPSGVAMHDGALYVSTTDSILRFDDIENHLQNPPEPVLITDALPNERHHGTRYMAFGPDGWLYVALGVPCNVCERPGTDEIVRMRPDGSGMETYARGVRNSVGLAFHPDNGVLWFTDNGRDRMGDNLPSCELNSAPEAGLHFGFPYCHEGSLPDPEFGQGVDCSQYQAPVAKLGPHVAPLGLKFYTGQQFPAEYHKQLFIAEHGSWNRSEKIGYRVKYVQLDENGGLVGQSVFASGWLQGESAWGRPSDILVMPDGSLLVADDGAGVLYRIRYEGDAS